MSNTLYGSPTVYTKLHKNRFISEGHGRSRGNRDPIDALWLGSRTPLRTLHLRCAAGILCSRIYQGTASKPTGSRAERREFPRVARDTVTRHSPHQRGARLHLFSRELEPSQVYGTRQRLFPSRFKEVSRGKGTGRWSPAFSRFRCTDATFRSVVAPVLVFVGRQPDPATLTSSSFSAQPGLAFKDKGHDGAHVLVSYK
jgi:hypothetical protein